MSILPRNADAYREPTVRSLLIVNAIPLVGVLFFGWDFFTLISIYWLETVIIGFYTLVRLGLITGMQVFFFIPFFIVHMGAFMSAHWLFLSFFVPPPELRGHPILSLQAALARPEVKWMVVFMLISHGVSFYWHFWRNRKVDFPPGFEMKKNKKFEAIIFEPYRRIVIMHVTIILGAFPVFMFGSATWMFAVLVVLKTVADLNSHSKVHGLL